MATLPETLITLTEDLLATPAGLLLFIVLLFGLLAGMRRQPAPVYTLVALETPREAGSGSTGCLPLLLVLLAVLFAITFL